VDVTLDGPAIATRRSLGSASWARRAARWLAALSLAASSGACILTQDIPDPALDVPTQYKYAGKGDAPPSLDWWRGFRSSELTQLMEEAQTVNLDIAAAVARRLGDLFAHFGFVGLRPHQWRS
jgi:hypothetical protein